MGPMLVEAGPRSAAGAGAPSKFAATTTSAHTHTYVTPEDLSCSKFLRPYQSHGHSWRCAPENN